MIVRTWVVTDQCTNTATFEQIIFVVQLEKAEIEIDICVEDDAIDLLNYLPEGFDTNGTFTIEDDDITLSGSIFNPADHEPLQEYIISYSSEDGSCKFNSDFFIEVNKDCLPCDPDNLIISKAVTVNGDGINDFFEISGLEQCDYAYNVMIFNRWGERVYESEDYKNDWGGFSPSGSIGNAGILPTGTYYYIITVANSEFPPRNGYIYIGTK
jgi:gliding motility-associated-like protein